MRFDALTFGLFLAATLASYLLPLSWTWRKALLLAASLLFYSAWNPPFVLLLIGSTLADFLIARRLAAAEAPLARKALLGLSLTVNLGLLGFFKYGGFLLENVGWLATALGTAYEPPPYSIVLPVGISFYTFQTLSYTIDVYRGRLSADWRFVDYALYVCFFPQLVAGPIVRAADFLPQTRAPRGPGAGNLIAGLGLFTAGLFQKAVLADGLFAPVANAAFNASPPPTGPAAWAGLLAFSGQIFCDFAGYSACAIGVARCLGFALPRNFFRPYAAIGFGDFWGRWHISLSTWFRDYVYIPLGGNRASEPRVAGNLLVTMLVSGLWHGAAWTFVIWGAAHGALLLAERTLLRRLPGEGFFRTPPGVRPLLMAGTFLAVTLCWLPFRCESLAHVLDYAAALGSPGSLRVGREALLAVAALAALVVGQWALRETPLPALAAKLPAPVVGAALGLLIYLICTFPRQDAAFIYFQF